MGSASSVAARAPPAAVVDALRHLDAALIGLAQVVVTDQAARAFVAGAADHEILSQLKHVDNRDVAALRADLGFAGFDASPSATRANDHTADGLATNDDARPTTLAGRTGHALSGVSA